MAGRQTGTVKNGRIFQGLGVKLGSLGFMVIVGKGHGVLRG